MIQPNTKTPQNLCSAEFIYAELVEKCTFLKKSSKSICKFKNFLLSLCRFSSHVTKCYESRRSESTPHLI